MQAADSEIEAGQSTSVALCDERAALFVSALLLYYGCSYLLLAVLMVGELYGPGLGAVIRVAGWESWGLLASTEVLTEPSLPACRHLALVTAVVLLLAGLAGRRLAAVRRGFARPAVIRVVLILSTSLFPILWIELLARPAVPWISGFTETFQRDPDLDWRLQPGVVSRWGGQSVTVNEQGYRGPALSVERDPEVYRILFLGDSVTFGFGIGADADTIPARVGRLLQERTGRAVEVLNAGVGGYSPWQELASYQRDFRHYRPDLVLLGFVLNDVAEKLQLRRFGGEASGFQVENLAPVWMQPVKRSGVVNLVHRIQVLLRVRWDNPHQQEVERVLNFYPGVGDPEKLGLGMGIATDNLQRLAAAVEEDGVLFRLAVYPFRFQLQPDASSENPIQDRLAEFAAREGHDLLDLLPPIRRRAAQEGLAADEVFLDHSHPSEQGAALFAEIIAGSLVDEVAGAAPSR